MMQTTEISAFSLVNLTTGYHLRNQDKILSRGLTANLKQGELTCLLGSNGVGKSTLLRTMARFQPILDGEILLFGQPLSIFSPDELARIVGVVLTDKLPTASLRVEELVAMGRMPFTGFWGALSKEDLKVVEDSLEVVGMKSFAHRRITTLSDGEIQKIMIAKALAQQTPVILLDEPVAFLDFPSKVEILSLLQKLAREKQKAILLSIHDLELALQTADRLWLLNNEGDLEQGAPHELAEKGSLDFFFRSSGLAFNKDTLQYTYRKSVVK
jgi:iron complex transport system ATP-binding protein